MVDEHDCALGLGSGSTYMKMKAYGEGRRARYQGIKFGGQGYDV